MHHFWQKIPPLWRAALATIPVLVVTAYLFVESRNSERLLLEAEIARQQDNVLLQFQSFVSARIDALKNVGNFVLSTAKDHSGDLTLFVGRVAAEVPGFDAIALVDGHGAVQRQFPALATGIEDVGDLPAFAKAMTSHTAAATGSYELPGGRQAFTVVVPVRREGPAAGAVVGTVLLSEGMRDLFGRDALDWNLEISDRTGRVAYRSVSAAGTSAAKAEMANERHVPVADVAWKVRLWPTALLLSTLRTAQPWRILVIGLLASAVTALASYLLSQHQARLTHSLRESERLASDVDEARRHLSDMVNGIDAVIWESDAASGRFTFLNDYARKLLGIDTARRLSAPARWFDHVHPDDRAHAEEISRQATRPGQTYPAEYRMIDAAGHVLWVREMITVIGHDERATGRRGVVVDITARMQAEEALRQSQKLESLGVLAGGIAHDFNNLLTTILGNAEMLSPFLVGSAAAGRKHLDKIERTTRRLAELTRQMLAYSGRGQFAVAEVDLNALITEMTELLAVSTPKNVRVIYGLDPGLPLMEADAAQIRQVVLNLLTNASEAIGEHTRGEVVINTAVETLDDARAEELFPGQEVKGGEYVRLEVADTGCGMSPETLTKIFDPFFTTKFTGRGLGLAALRGIVRRHHGGIRIFSRLGEGTVFTLLFPASPAQAALPVHAENAPCLPGLRGATMLIVDDEESLRSLMADALESEGVTILQAVDGEDGIEQYHRHEDELDAVILDLTMPKLSGEEVFRQIKARRPALPVILCSGYTQEDVARQFVGVELDGFIEKPFTPSQLIKELRALLAQGRSPAASSLEGPAAGTARRDRSRSSVADGS